MTVYQYAGMNIHNTSTFMGLENSLSENTATNIRNRRRAVWEAVSTEQKRQIDIGIHDPLALSVVAGNLSKLSRTRARIIGLLHAKTI